MLRIVNIFLMLAVVVGAAVVYDMKMASENLADQVRQLTKAIEQEREDIRFYKAQWSALNQPSRLQGIVNRYNSYLQLEPLSAEQITTLEALPVKPVNLEPVAADSMGGYAGMMPKVQ